MDKVTDTFHTAESITLYLLPSTYLVLRTSSAANSKLAQCLNGAFRNNLTFLLPLHDSIFNIHNLPQNFKESISITKTTIMYKFIPPMQLYKKEQSNYKPNYINFLFNKQKQKQNQSKTNRGDPNQPTNQSYSEAVVGTYKDVLMRNLSF